MPRIAVVTDTDASLPDGLVEEWGIILVPIKIHFGEETFNACVDIDDRQMFRRINQEGKLPTTAAPSPGDFAGAFQRAFDRGAEEILCFTVSSEVSGTFQAALTARELVPEINVKVMDTWSVSMGQGFMVLEAAKLAGQGFSGEEIVRKVEEVRSRTRLFAALATLKYMAMSGRVGHLTAGMAGFLDIRPILTIQNGKLDLLEKVRTRKKAWEKILNLTVNSLQGREIEQMFILHVDALDITVLFEKQLRDVLGYEGSIAVSDLTPGLSVHAGPGVVGVSYLIASEQT